MHAVVLGSNALNDKNILAELCAPRFAATARSFLDSGRGIFGLQQIGLAMRKGPSLTCLPEPYGRVVPVVPPTGDRALTEGLLDLGAITAAHVAMTYPNPVNLKGLRQDALAFRAYQGLYRHYWDAVDLFRLGCAGNRSEGCRTAAPWCSLRRSPHPAASS